MTRSSLRAHLAIGSSVAAAALGTVLVAHSASASTPPSEPPSTDAPAASGDADHDALVDAIVSTSADSGLPVNRDCVAGIVEQIPPEDVTTILAEIETSAAVADITIPEIEMPDISMPDLSELSIPELPELSLPDLGDIEIPEISLPDLGAITIPDLGDISIPEIPDLSDMSIPPIPEIPVSEETLALSRELISCIEGDADPALVEQVVALAETSTPAGVLDLDCTAKVLSTFPDEVLQQIIDSGAVEADPTEVDPAISAEVAKLFACTDLTTVMATGEPSAGSVAAEAAPATTTA